MFASALSPVRSHVSSLLTPGIFWLLVAIIGAALFFSTGLTTLWDAWQTPVYSHGFLIPVLSAWLWLKQLKEVPVNAGPKSDRWPGFAVVIFSMLLGLAGTLAT